MHTTSKHNKNCFEFKHKICYPLSTNGASPRDKCMFLCVFCNPFHLVSLLVQSIVNTSIIVINYSIANFESPFFHRYLEQLTPLHPISNIALYVFFSFNSIMHCTILCVFVCECTLYYNQFYEIDKKQKAIDGKWVSIKNIN